MDAGQPEFRREIALSIRPPRRPAPPDIAPILSEWQTLAYLLRSLILFVIFPLPFLNLTVIMLLAPIWRYVDGTNNALWGECSRCGTRNGNWSKREKRTFDQRSGKDGSGSILLKNSVLLLQHEIGVDLAARQCG